MTWPTVKLGEICEINPKAPKGIDDEAPVSFLSMRAVSENGYVQSEDLRRYGDVKKGYTYFEKGDVLVAKITPCFENGKASCTDVITHQLGFGSTEFHVVRPGPSLDARFIFYLLWSAQFRIIGEKGMTGSAGQKRVPAGLIRNLEIPLPPLEEQKRIAAILDKADQLRQKRRKAIALLDSLTQSIFVEMFGELISSDNLVTKLPLKQIVKEFRYGTSQKSDFEGCPTLRIPNIVDGSISLDDLKFVPASQTEMERLHLKIGDILFVRTNGNPDYVGRSAVVSEEIIEMSGRKVKDFIFASYLIRARPNRDMVNPKYLQLFLSSNHGRRSILSRAKTSAGQFNINTQGLGSIDIPLPVMSEQNKLEDHIVGLDVKKSLLKDQLRHYDSLFASLQSRAFAGEL